MSRTYKKYPLVKELANGVFYNDWKDIPERTIYYTCHRPIMKTVLVKEYKPLTNPKRNKHWDYFEMVPKEVETGEYKKCVYKTKRHIDTESCYYYNEKSAEGWSACRQWHSGGVGKANKQIRSRKHRAEVRDVIVHWKKGDFSRDIERERNHDRWDRW